MRTFPRTLAVTVASCVAALGACISDDEDAVTPPVATSDATRPGERVYDPALTGGERVAIVSQWAHEQGLLTADEVVAALGESTTTALNAQSPAIAMDEDPWRVGFRGPFPADEMVAHTGVAYVLRREGGSREVITFVSEYVAYDPGLAEAYAAMEAGEAGRNTPDERYDPAPLGVAAFAYETDGGSGALDRLVVVYTGDALIVIVASPASPDAPDADLSGTENLTRAQVDALVAAAVEKVAA